MYSSEDSRQKRFLSGVMILTPAMLISKCIGLFYKVPLLQIVGVTGMAYFLSAYHIYSLLFVLSAAGLPTALSLLVSRAVVKGGGGVRRLFATATATFLAFAVIGTVLLTVFSPQIAASLSMKEAAESIVAIAPALSLSVLIGAIRGLFQGHGNMLPSAVSEVLEAVGKLVFGILLATAAREGGAPLERVAAAAVFGITLGMALSALFLLTCLFLCRRTLFAGGREGAPPLGALLRVALPVTVSASVMSLVSLVDTVLISGRLQALGFAPGVANAMYSSYGNLSVPLYNLVPTLLSPLMLALSPTVSAAVASGDGRGAGRAFATAFRLAVLIALPASLGLAVFAEPILSMIYYGQTGAVQVAAPLLSLLSPAILLTVLAALSGAVLQAVGKPMLPVFSMLTGAAVKLLLEWGLLTLPAVHIYGAPISTLSCQFVVLCINFACLGRYLPSDGRLWLGALRPLAASVLAVLGGAALFVALQEAIARGIFMPLSLGVTVLLYAVFALRFGAVTREELLCLPGGACAVTVLEKTHLLKKEVLYDKR